MAAMVSHAGTCCLGLNMDGTAVADPGLLVRCIQEGFDEVLALGAQGAPPASNRPSVMGALTSRGR